MEVSEQVIKILDALAEKIGVSIDWTSSNIIPYLQELFTKYIQHEVWTSIFFIVIGLVILGVGLILHRQIYVNDEFGVTKVWREDKSLRYLAYTGICILYFIGVIMVLCQLHDIITCIVFPEKFVIQELLPLIQ